MARTIWIKNPLAIWTGNDSDAGGGVVIKDNIIVELVAKGKTPTVIYDETFDSSECVVLPGLINCHHHLYQTLTRACPSALNKDLFPWLRSLYTIWANLDEEAIYLSSQLGLAELLLSGCTTAADHHYLFPQSVPNAIDIQVEAAKPLNMRTLFTRGSMSLSVKDGGLPPDHVVQDHDTILADSERVIQRYHQAQEGAMMQIALAPCSPFSVTPELMRSSAELARQYGVRLHTHLGETNDENDFCLAQFGKRPVEYLEDVGWLAPDVWLAHGIHFTADEITKLGHHNVGISHCPSSNMLLASGICHSLALEQAGAIIGLGVDGSASNDGSNMIQELRQALFIQRLKYPASSITHQKVFGWATQGGANIMGRSDIGEIAVGKQADLALFKLDEMRFSGHGDPLAALLLCGAHKAEHVMVAGNWRVSHGAINDLDIESLMQKHHAKAQQLQFG
ncbi:8-oxoguanine deaminase [Methylophaga sp.]|uniref:8-oxoguanine deaminase n=1 Tax=Methylophaga sp. TaxID=2024840 RepID=UPI0027255074|nr:8-oxoguanine deaminase [Methylophaga sp.]MDO8826855.1 8-oxoguanine deaminase [Methylophaga sp.]